jgi:hypothetical protein
MPIESLYMHAHMLTLTNLEITEVYKNNFLDNETNHGTSGLAVYKNIISPK